MKDIQFNNKQRFESCYTNRIIGFIISLLITKYIEKGERGEITIDSKIEVLYPHRKDDLIDIIKSKETNPKTDIFLID